MLDERYYYAHFGLGRAYGQLRKFSDAIRALKTARTVVPDSAMIAAELGYAYARSGEEARSREILDELLEKKETRFIDPYIIAFLHVGLGDNASTLDSLEEAYEVRSTWMPWLGVEPKFDELWSEPRYLHLLRRVGLPTERSRPGD